MSVVGPHLAVWDLINMKPLRAHLVTFFQFAQKSVPSENMNLQNIRLTRPRKIQNAYPPNISHVNTRLFFHLPLSGLVNFLPFFNLSPESIPPPGAKSFFLHS